MHKYKAFFNRKEMIVEAETSYAALQKAREIFKPSAKQKHMVHVLLVEKSGEIVTHTPSN